jgi:hypothetical protein
VLAGAGGPAPNDTATQLVLMKDTALASTSTGNHIWAPARQGRSHSVPNLYLFLSVVDGRSAGVGRTREEPE